MIVIGTINDIDKLSIDGVLVYGKCTNCDGIGCDICEYQGVGLFMIKLEDFNKIIS